MKYAEWLETVPFTSMLVPMIQHQRKDVIREEQAEYNTQPSDSLLGAEAPIS